MAMFNPPHPGETVRGLCLKPLELAVTDAAKGLGFRRPYPGTSLGHYHRKKYPAAHFLWKGHDKGPLYIQCAMAWT